LGLDDATSVLACTLVAGYAANKRALTVDHVSIDLDSSG
jgi:hypothetical protein